MIASYMTSFMHAAGVSAFLARSHRLFRYVFLSGMIRNLGCGKGLKDVVRHRRAWMSVAADSANTVVLPWRRRRQSARGSSRPRDLADIAVL